MSMFFLGGEGVFRDNKGICIMGYAGHYPYTSVINIELMTLLRGLQMAVTHNLTPLQIQLDAQEVITILQSNTSIHSPIILDCRFLIQ